MVNINLILILLHKFDDITHNVDEVLFRVKITTLDQERRKIQESFSHSSMNLKSIKITTKYMNTLGKCYSVQPTSDIVKLGIIGITIVANIDVYIYMGYPGQFMFNTRTRVRILVS